MKRFIAGAALGIILGLSTGASAHVGTTNQTALPRVCILARSAGHYSEVMRCDLARAESARGRGTVYVSEWIRG